MTRIGTVKNRPEDCTPGDLIDIKKVKDLPLMSNKSALAFKRWIGERVLHGHLVREGPRIFLVGESELAKCMYNHTREF